ncbi:hypothetical protein [Variovorax sp. GT1P44]|uniref:hypothetical protein n=1 Tax=Variovorax sp. GT1P44 TaxID=3443742 RepID=UPI003F474BCA
MRRLFDVFPEFQMKKVLVLTAALAVGQLLALSAHAQVMGTDDKAAARAERRVQGSEAARGPQLGEGQPIPAPAPKTTAKQRSAARAERRTVGAEAARGPQMGEGDPIPQAEPKVSSAERASARKSRRSTAAQANKSGEIKAKGEQSY